MSGFPAPVDAPAVATTAKASYLYAAPGQAGTLKLALLLPTLAPEWMHGFLQLAQESRYLDVHVLLVDDASVDEPRAAVDLPLDLRICVWMERHLTGMFMHLLRRPRHGPLDRRQLPESNRLGAARIDNLEQARHWISSHHPDVIIMPAALGWGNEFAGLVPRGCWEVGNELTHPTYAGVSLLTPILKQENVSRTGLELLGNNGQEQELVESWGASRPISFSQHRDLAFLKLPALLLRALRTLANSDLGKHSNGRLRLQPGAMPFRAGDGLRLFWTTSLLALQSRARRARDRQPWFLLLPRGKAPLDPAAPELRDFHSLVAPGPNYWADPFPIQHDGQRLLLVEEFVDATQRGVIACLELLADGSVVHRGVVLEGAAHLSYPQAFQWEGQWYMTVESSEAKRVCLYQAEAFPLRWKPFAVLLEDRVCVDPTLYHHDGHWYLFGNISESGGNPSDELFLFVSEQLAGPYLAHPLNPIVADVRCSRPAGRIFSHNNRLIRPAQRCAPVYGAAVVFNEILELSPEHYLERVLASLEPDMLPCLDGCHTYNTDGRFEVLDAHGIPPPMCERMAVLPGSGGSPQVETIAAGKPGAFGGQQRFWTFASLVPWWL